MVYRDNSYSTQLGQPGPKADRTGGEGEGGIRRKGSRVGVVNIKVLYLPDGTCSPFTLSGVRTTLGIITAFFLCLPD